MLKSFKILGLLLTYPEGSLYRAGDELLGILRDEAIISPDLIEGIGEFLRIMRGKELLQVQADYVAVFDSGRSHCLHLFEHVHADSRSRGQAMVDLSEAYAARGLYIDSSELPDYLPLFMEYLSHCPLSEARQNLAEAIDVIATIGARLEHEGSPYALVFSAIISLSSVVADKAVIAKALKSSRKDPETLQELDEQWREAEAFGPDSNPSTQDDCGSCNVFPETSEALERMLKDI